MWEGLLLAMRGTGYNLQAECERSCLARPYKQVCGVNRIAGLYSARQFVWFGMLRSVAVKP